MPSLESRLLLVTDRQQTKGRPLMSVLARVLKAGRTSIQLRERDLCAADLLTLAGEIQRLMEPHRGQLVINDRLDVALSLEEAGVHLRNNSLPVSVARRLLSPLRLLGASAHSVAEAVEAEANGADYVVLGPVFDTPSKRQFGPPLGLPTVEEAARAVGVPIFAIGGVTAGRAREVRRAGAFGVAVITAILSADDVEAATTALLEAVTAPV
ncbi:MAG TPA: thiamine phosphate synthase [Nitrospira sp.]|nr:thiamine phosphate synthase [Nitrospira sp.]HET9865917.1 thiamine phosphate synthase [Nitrospira sp.]